MDSGDYVAFPEEYVRRTGHTYTAPRFDFTSLALGEAIPSTHRFYMQRNSLAFAPPGNTEKREEKIEFYGAEPREKGRNGDVLGVRMRKEKRKSSEKEKQNKERQGEEEDGEESREENEEDREKREKRERLKERKVAIQKMNSAERLQAQIEEEQEGFWKRRVALANERLRREEQERERVFWRERFRRIERQLQSEGFDFDVVDGVDPSGRPDIEIDRRDAEHVARGARADNHAQQLRRRHAGAAHGRTAPQPEGLLHHSNPPREHREGHHEIRRRDGRDDSPPAFRIAFPSYRDEDFD